MTCEQPIAEDAQASPNLVRFPNVEVPVSGSVSSMPFHEMSLPKGYFADENGLHYFDDDENGDVHPEWLCSPIEVVGSCRRADGKGWGRVVEVVDGDGRRHRVIIEASALNGTIPALLRPLHDAGLQVSSGVSAKQLVAEFLRSRPPEPKFLRVSRTGWLDGDFDTFVMADGSTIGRKAAILENSTGNIGTAIAVAGSVEEWRDTVAAHCVGNPLMLLAVSQAFAGPLLAPLGFEGGGFHLRGLTSRGKSTLLRVALSVWGSPVHIPGWRATDNGLEQLASRANDGLLALDEMHEVSPQIVGEAVYMLANGRGKQRMNTSGKSGSAESWKVALLSSGEISLADHMASGGKKIQAGQDIRLIDIDAAGRAFGAFDDLHEESEASRFADRVQEAAASHYGHVGRQFVERLIENAQNYDPIRRMVERTVQRFVDQSGLAVDGQVRRALRRFALAAAAGEVATHFDLTGWQRGEASEGVLLVANEWLHDREVDPKSDIDAALAQSRAYLSANLARFNQRGEAAGQDGWRDVSWFYILPDAWVRMHGHNRAVDVARLHRSAGLLRTDKGETLQFKMGRDTEGRPKVYAVSVRVLEQ